MTSFLYWLTYVAWIMTDTPKYSQQWQKITIIPSIGTYMSGLDDGAYFRILPTIVTHLYIALTTTDIPLQCKRYQKSLQRHIYIYTLPGNSANYEITLLPTRRTFKYLTTWSKRYRLASINHLQGFFLIKYINRLVPCIPISL